MLPEILQGEVLLLGIVGMTAAANIGRSPA
jgi:hypothetical protein